MTCAGCLLPALFLLPQHVTLCHSHHGLSRASTGTAVSPLYSSIASQGCSLLHLIVPLFIICNEDSVGSQAMGVQAAIDDISNERELL